MVVESIQRRHASSHACIVAAPSWYTRTKGWEAYQEDIFCDLLLFDCQLGGLHLFTLFKSCSTARRDKEYGYNAAKALKNALVLYGGCYEWFYIGYHMVYCCDCCSEIGSVFRTDLRNQYPHQYTCEEEEANEEKLNRILESLVSFLGAVPSLYSNEQGVCFFNLLTMEEFGSFYGAITPVDRNELLIGSVPGTERTVMHLRLISLCYGLVICGKEVFVIHDILDWYSKLGKKTICILLAYKCTGLSSFLTSHSFCRAGYIFKVPILLFVYNLGLGLPYHCCTFLVFSFMYILRLWITCKLAV